MSALLSASKYSSDSSSIFLTSSNDLPSADTSVSSDRHPPSNAQSRQLVTSRFSLSTASLHEHSSRPATASLISKRLAAHAYGSASTSRIGTGGSERPFTAPQIAYPWDRLSTNTESLSSSVISLHLGQKEKIDTSRTSHRPFSHRKDYSILLPAEQALERARIHARATGKGWRSPRGTLYTSSRKEERNNFLSRSDIGMYNPSNFTRSTVNTAPWKI